MEVKIKQTVTTTRIRTIEVDDGSTPDDIRKIIEFYDYDGCDDTDAPDIVVRTEGFATDVNEDEDPLDSESWVDFKFDQFEG